MTIDQAAEIVYNVVHERGYANDWSTAQDKTTWRKAIAKLLASMNEEGTKNAMAKSR